MNINFNIPKIQELLKQFYTLTDLVVTFCDSDFTHLTSSRSHSGFCSLINSKYSSFCDECDFHGLLEAKNAGGVYSYTCHAGLIESVIPIYDHGIIIAYIIIGQYRDSAKARSSWEHMQLLTAEYDLNKEDLFNEYIRLPVLSNEQATAMFDIFRSFIRLMWKEGLIKSEDSSLYARIYSYIDTHLKEPIRIEDLCKEFFISKNALYKLIAANANTTPNELILTKRLNCAKQLLINTNLSITQIAEECGFSNQNYFIRAFKKQYGISPLQFKKKYLRNEIEK